MHKIDWEIKQKVFFFTKLQKFGLQTSRHKKKEGQT